MTAVKRSSRHPTRRPGEQSTWSTVLLVVLGIVLLGAVPAGAASAAGVTVGRDADVPAGQVLNKAFFGTGQDVTVAGTVNGDVYAAGQTVTISGTVNGDVLAAGQNVTISGRVVGNVRIAAQNVTISSGTVARSATIASQSLTLGRDGTIGTDLVASAQTASIDGRVARDVFATSGQLGLAGTVGRNLTASVGYLELKDGSRVGGDVAYTSAQTLERSPGASVGGTVTRTEPPVRQRSTAAAVGGYLLKTLYWILALLLVMLAAALLVPLWLRGTTDRAFPTPWRALLVGFLAEIAVPVALVIVALTFIGLPLAVFAGIVWVAVVLAGFVVAAHYVGRLVLRDRRPVLLTALTGGLILAVLLAIPFLNVLVWLASSFIGTGALLLHAAAARPYRRGTVPAGGPPPGPRPAEPVEPTEPAVSQEAAPGGTAPAGRGGQGSV